MTDQPIPRQVTPHKPNEMQNVSNEELLFHDEKVNFKGFFEADYLSDASQMPFMKHICLDVVEEFMQWASKKRAQTLFFKEPDIFVMAKGQISWQAIKKLLKLQKDRNLVDELYYLTEKELCYNDLATNNAHAIWTIDVDVEKQPYANFIKRSDIVDILEDKISNSVIQVRIRRDVFSFNNTKWYLLEIRNIDYIETIIATAQNGKFAVLKDKDIPKEVTANYKDRIGKKEWNYNFVPFTYIKNTPEAFGDIKYVVTNLYKEILLRGQELIETLVSGTKVVISEKSNHSVKKIADKTKKFKAALEAATRVVILRDAPLIPGRDGNPTIAFGQPIMLEVYDRVRKANKNEILQKIGAATDVDSKGTVQQSQGELLLAQGDEFRVVQWKNANRQNKIQELMDKFSQIYQANNEPGFENYESVRILLGKNEIISEKDLLQNLKDALELQLINKVVAFARFNNINISEARDLLMIGDGDWLND